MRGEGARIGIPILIAITVLVVFFGQAGYDLLMTIGGVVMLLAWGAAVISVAWDGIRKRREP